jgi:acetyl-CoA synthetase
VGRRVVKAHDLSSLRILGSVGEPINPEAWMWYRDVVGGGRPDRRHLVADRDRPDHDLAAARTDDDQAGLGDVPDAGIGADVVNDEGRERPARTGRLPDVSHWPWPAMLRGIYRRSRALRRDLLVALLQARQERWVYFAGDGAKRDEEGYYWLLGRVDDVMNVSGHRISTLEVESALVDHQPSPRPPSPAGRTPSPARRSPRS